MDGVLPSSSCLSSTVAAEGPEHDTAPASPWSPMQNDNGRDVCAICLEAMASDTTSSGASSCTDLSSTCDKSFNIEQWGKGGYCTHRLSCGHTFHAHCVLQLRAFRHLGCPICRTRLEPSDFPVLPNDTWATMPVDMVFKTANKYYQVLASRIESPFRQVDGDNVDGWSTLNDVDKSEMNKIVAMWATAANRGLKEAQYNLAIMYRHGRGIPQSNAEAVRWYRCAASQGHRDAQNNLGFMYNHSRGVDKDEFEAVTWYRRAAEQGLPEAQYNLGVMYRQGRGVDLVDVATGECLERHNKVQALRWYRRAGQNGYEDAWAAIERLVSEDSVVDDERKSADGRTQQTNNNNNNNNNNNDDEGSAAVGSRCPPRSVLDVRGLPSISSILSSSRRASASASSASSASSSSSRSRSSNSGSSNSVSSNSGGSGGSGGSSDGPFMSPPRHRSVCAAVAAAAMCPRPSPCQQQRNSTFAGTNHPQPGSLPPSPSRRAHIRHESSPHNNNNNNNNNSGGNARPPQSGCNWQSRSAQQKKSMREGPSYTCPQLHSRTPFKSRGFVRRALDFLTVREV